VLEKKIKTLRSLKSGKTDFMNFNVIWWSKHYNPNPNHNHICELLPNTLTYKLHTQLNNQLHKDGQKLRLNDVGGISKHGATVGIECCRCNVVVQKLYCIKLVFTNVYYKLLLVPLYSEMNTDSIENGFWGFFKKIHLYFVTHTMCSDTHNAMFHPSINLNFVTHTMCSTTHNTMFHPSINLNFVTHVMCSATYNTMFHPSINLNFVTHIMCIATQNTMFRRSINLNFVTHIMCSATYNTMFHPSINLNFVTHHVQCHSQCNIPSINKS
jgi:hypothetical protein